MCWKYNKNVNHVTVLIPKIWKQCKHSWPVEWINILWNFYKMEYHAAIKIVCN